MRPLSITSDLRVVFRLHYGFKNWIENWINESIGFEYLENLINLFMQIIIEYLYLKYNYYSDDVVRYVWELAWDYFFININCIKAFCNDQIYIKSLIIDQTVYDSFVYAISLNYRKYNLSFIDQVAIICHQYTFPHISI